MTARARKCARCGAPLPSTASTRRKYCDDDCRRGKAKPKAVELGPVAADTEKAIAVATRNGTLRDQHAGAVAALRFLAAKIDTEEQLRNHALQLLAEGELKRPPPIDNVSVPTYLKYCESLGLTPAGESRLMEKPKETGGGGKLAKLSSIPRPSA